MKKIITILTLVLLVGSSIAIAGDVFHGGDIIYTEPVKAVLFSHAYHVEEMGFPCESCHNGELFEMQALAAQKNADFTMKGLAEGKYCGACHDEKVSDFDSDTQCARCHIGVKGFEKLTGGGEEKKSGH